MPTASCTISNRIYPNRNNNYATERVRIIVRDDGRGLNVMMMFDDGSYLECEFEEAHARALTMALLDVVRTLKAEA